MNENLGSLRSSAKTQQSQTPCTMLHSLQLTDPTMLHRSLSQTPRTVFKTACIKIYLDSVTKPTKATFSCQNILNMSEMATSHTPQFFTGEPEEHNTVPHKTTPQCFSDTYFIMHICVLVFVYFISVHVFVYLYKCTCICTLHHTKLYSSVSSVTPASS